MSQSSCSPDFEPFNQGYTFHMPIICPELRTCGFVFRKWIGLSPSDWSSTRTGYRLQKLWIAVVPSRNLRIFVEFLDPLADVSIVEDLTNVARGNGSQEDSIAIREKPLLGRQKLSKLKEGNLVSMISHTTSSLVRCRSASNLAS